MEIYQGLGLVVEGTGYYQIVKHKDKYHYLKVSNGEVSEESFNTPDEVYQFLLHKYQNDLTPLFKRKGDKR